MWEERLLVTTPTPSPHVHSGEGEIMSCFVFLSLIKRRGCFLPSQPLPPTGPWEWTGCLVWGIRPRTGLPRYQW